MESTSFVSWRAFVATLTAALTMLISVSSGAFAYWMAQHGNSIHDGAAVETVVDQRFERLDLLVQEKLGRISDLMGVSLRRVEDLITHEREFVQNQSVLLQKEIAIVERRLEQLEMRVSEMAGP